MFLAQSGVKVVAISDAEGAFRKASGIDVGEAIAHVVRRGTLAGYKGATRMRRAALEPQPRVQPGLVDHSTGEAHAGLENNPGLLGVRGYRSRCSRCGQPSAKHTPQHRGFPDEVVS